MHESDSEFEKLDALINAHSDLNPPADFSRRVMRRIGLQAPWMAVWERPWVQWVAVSIGLALTFGRLLGYIFSAWLSIEVAG